MIVLSKFIIAHSKDTDALWNILFKEKDIIRIGATLYSFIRKKKDDPFLQKYMAIAESFKAVYSRSNRINAKQKSWDLNKEPDNSSNINRRIQKAKVLDLKLDLNNVPVEQPEKLNGRLSNMELLQIILMKIKYHPRVLDLGMHHFFIST